NSPLFKTSLAGRDPNWGRVMSAIGASGAVVQEERVGVWYGDEQVAAGGEPKDGVRWERVKAELAKPDFTVAVDLGVGSGHDHVWNREPNQGDGKINTGTS